jgi:outer membrane protein assembly factor BamB
VIHRAAPLLFALSATAEDWPEWRGRGRLGIWRETGIVETLPPEGPPIRWRTPIRGGYAGPSVAGGRVFVTDYTDGVERALALDERTGRVLWTREWPADYRGLDYATGPRATPTVDGDRVYALGAKGALWCLRVSDGAVVWAKDFPRDYATEVPGWGMAAAPLVDGSRVIAVVGGRPDAKVVAFDKLTGRELWRALSAVDSEPGYSQPIQIEAGGRRQFIVWHAGGVASLDPATGRVHWEFPFRVRMNTPIATPVAAGARLLVSQFFNGSRMLRLDADLPRATLDWSGSSDNEISSDGLHALIGTPAIDGDYLYGVCSYGQLRCLRVATGERVWESQEVTRERARNATAHLVRHGDRWVFFNDRGELIFAMLSPEGYREIARAPLIRPTSPPGARRELGAVVWSHPAFANGHVVARNDREILRADLRKAAASN